MNPYAKFVTGTDLIASLAESPAKLVAAVEAWRARGVDEAVAPGGWSVRQVLAHLADTEIAFSFRLRQAAAETGHTIQPFDQDKWSSGYAKVDVDAALALYGVLRKWNVAWLRGLAPEVFDKIVVHPERGAMTFRTIVETMAGHDMNHLLQFVGHS